MMTEEIDRLLEGLSSDHTQAPRTLKREVMVQLQPKTDLTAWFKASLWRPVCASALPLIVGFAMGMYWPTDAIDPGLDDLLLADNQIEFEFEDIEIFTTGVLDE